MEGGKEGKGWRSKDGDFVVGVGEEGIGVVIVCCCCCCCCCCSGGERGIWECLDRFFVGLLLSFECMRRRKL